MIQFTHVVHVTVLLVVGMCLSGRAADLLGNNTFDENAIPWSVYTASNELASGEVSDGKFVMHVTASGENKWDTQFRHQGLTLEQNHNYTIRFTIIATAATQVYAKIG